jgi:hypothetical protein
VGPSRTGCCAPGRYDVGYLIGFGSAIYAISPLFTRGQKKT